MPRHLLRLLLVATLATAGLALLAASPPATAEDPPRDTVSAQFTYPRFPGDPAQSSKTGSVYLEASSWANGESPTGHAQFACTPSEDCDFLYGNVECMHVVGKVAHVAGNLTRQVGGSYRYYIALFDRDGDGRADGSSVPQIVEDVPWVAVPDCRIPPSYLDPSVDPPIQLTEGGAVSVVDRTEPNTAVGDYPDAVYPATYNDRSARVRLVFERVTSTGLTTTQHFETGPALPANIVKSPMALPYWTFQTTASYVGGVSICFDPQPYGEISHEVLAEQMMFGWIDGEWIRMGIGGGQGAANCGQAETLPEYVILGRPNDLALAPQEDITIPAEDADGSWMYREPPLATGSYSDGVFLYPTCTGWGSKFPVGTTTVTCTASFRFYANVPPPVTFNVTVSGSVTPETPAGSEVQVFPPDQTGRHDIALHFDDVTSAGSTTVTTTQAGPTPSGFTLAGNPPVYYNLESTATFTGSVEVCIKVNDYDTVDYNDFLARRLYHYDGNQWVDITTRVDWNTGQVCGETTHFSPFAIGSPPKTEQALADLRSSVIGVGPGKSLQAKVESVQTRFAAGNIRGACTGLTDFRNEVRAQSGKKIPITQAQALTAAAERIRGLMGC